MAGGRVGGRAGRSWEGERGGGGVSVGGRERGKEGREKVARGRERGLRVTSNVIVTCS